MLVGIPNPSPEFLFSNRIYPNHMPCCHHSSLPRRTQNETAIFHEMCFHGVIIIRASARLIEQFDMYKCMYVYIYIQWLYCPMCIFNIILCKYVWRSRGFRCVRVRVIVCAYDTTRLSGTFFFATPRILYGPTFCHPLLTYTLTRINLHR